MGKLCMTAMATHPFIKREQMYGTKAEPVQKTVTREGLDSEYIEDRPFYKKPSIIISSVTAVLLAGVTAVGAMLYAAGNTDESENPNLVNNALARVEIAAPQIIQNQIPDNYPGIYPGEQRVIYHLAPLPNETTVEEPDETGCVWLRVPGKTSGLTAYPKIGDDNRQVCTDPTKAIEPLQSRMAKDTLPEVHGSTLRILDIIDAKTGKSMMANVVPPLEEMIGTPMPQQASAPTGIPNIPSQQAPAKQVAISTAADAGSRPAAPSQPAQRQTSSQYRREPSTLEPIRRAEPYIAPEDDVMVPISGNSSNELRAIRPGERMQQTGPRPTERPSGSPMEGYASISGN